MHGNVFTSQQRHLCVHIESAYAPYFTQQKYNNIKYTDISVLASEFWDNLVPTRVLQKTNTMISCSCQGGKLLMDNLDHSTQAGVRKWTMFLCKHIHLHLNA